MKPSLQLKISQHLALTPQLQQSIRLLQLSTIELNTEIERMLLENPMLERDADDESEGAAAVELPDPVVAADDGQSSELRGDEDFEPSVSVDPPETIDAAYDAASDDDLGEAAEWRSEAGSGTGNGHDGEDGEFQEHQAAATSLREHLESQIALMQFSDRDRALVRLLADALHTERGRVSSMREYVYSASTSRSSPR